MKATRTTFAALREIYGAAIFATFIMLAAAASVVAAYVDSAEAGQISMLNVSFDTSR